MRNHQCDPSRRVPVRWAILFVLCGVACLQARAQREPHTLNDGWLFRYGACMQQVCSVIDSTWTPVHLPHSWNADAYRVKAYRQGEGWYVRQLTLPSRWEGKRLLLRFEGVSKAAAVYVNGQEAGRHAGGYTSFTLDITPLVHRDTSNWLAVQVDNARQDIPPISADFTFFGGIYRDVWLTAVNDCHIAVDEWGAENLFITTPAVSEEQAELHIRTRVANASAAPARLVLEHRLYAPAGEHLQTLSQQLRLKAGESAWAEVDARPIAHPALWTPETPALYRVETVLRDSRSGEVLDRSEHHTAFRWYRFDASEGFFLNGKPYKLRGICRHQDQAPFGPALTDEMHRRDFRLMKEMGANFIRISHYPQDDALLEMCDRMGMLAWEEIPVIDIVPDTPGYAETCEQNLREMIRQHRNHPSVIVWGYMNEILLQTQRRYRTPETLQPVLDRTLELVRRLERVVKEEDPDRPSVMAFHGSNAYNETGISDVVDVVGWNLYQGWYGSDLNDFDRFLAEQHRQQPAHPLIVSEYGAGSDRRLHSLNPHAFDFSVEYQQSYLEHYVPVLEQTPYICGGTLWNFIDFSAALREESMPRINNKGLVTNAREPKDVYYYYKALWRQDVPVLHIATRDWLSRSGVQEGDVPVVQPVKVYTNLSRVELLLDGISLGVKETANGHALFEVPFRAGEPLLTARGMWQERPVEDAVRVKFTAVPSRLTEQTAWEGLELAVNVGSNCFYTAPASHLTWLPDRPYEPGGWGYRGGKEKSTQAEIFQTSDGPLVQSYREGIEAYRFDCPAGTYEVELTVADVSRPAEQGAYLLGRAGTSSSGNGVNRFAVKINGEEQEESWCPGEEAGYFAVSTRRYVVRNGGDCVEVGFTPLSGQTFLSAIKLRRLF